MEERVKNRHNCYLLLRPQYFTFDISNPTIHVLDFHYVAHYFELKRPFYIAQTLT